MKAGLFIMLFLLLVLEFESHIISRQIKFYFWRRKNKSCSPSRLEEEHILSILRSFYPYAFKKREWGGWIHLSTRKVEGLREGEPAAFSYDLSENQERGREGWASFHTHPPDDKTQKILPPSTSDFITALERGTPEYVITPEGIWKIDLSEILSPLNVMWKLYRVYREVKAGADKKGFIRCQLVNSLIQKHLPVTCQKIDIEP